MAQTDAEGLGSTTLSATGAQPRRDDGEAPAQIGRYTILKAIGAGGMGVVYAAYDTDLDRKIAIKLLHQGVVVSGPDTVGHGRLLREAQAMAKISHPNVLQVFEVGTHGAQVYLALEFVEGCTLEAWLAEPRTWRAIVDIFVQAGRGLQAAHEAGVVHRDFKPENVLVDRSGRARVMDFGLARATGTAQPVPRDIPITGGHSSLDTHLTATGAVMGTPLYMAPEQHAGATTDARTDEFAFCVALYDALYSQRPFPGDTLRTLAGNVMRGLVREPPRERRVPTWLRRAVLRGLAPAPEDRYPGMQPLLIELARDHGAARRRTLLACGAAALLLAGGWGFAAARTAEDQRCRGAVVQLAGTWDRERAEALTLAFAATGRPHAHATAERVRAHLDARAAAWAGLHAAACEAHARGEASDELYDRQVACLERRRSETRALVDLLARADAEVVDRAMSAAMALPPISACSDTAALLARVKPPEDPALAAEVLRLEAELDRAKVLQDAAKYREGLALAGAAADAADTSGHRPVIAEAQLRIGELHSRANDYAAAEPPLWAALWAAEAGHHDEAAAAAWTELVRLTVKVGQVADARRWAERAGAAVARLGGDTLAEARLDNELGNLAYHAEDHVEAAERYRRALELRRAALGPHHIDVTASLANLGNALLGLDRHEEALAVSLEALHLREATLGPEHPDVAASLNNIGVIYKNAGRYDEAAAALNRARQIWRRTLGPDNPAVLHGIINLGTVYYQRGDLATAGTLFEQALELAERVLPPDHPVRLKAYANAGALFLLRGDLVRGEAVMRATLEAHLRIHGPDHPAVATALDNLGSVAADLDRFDEAFDLFSRGLAILERSGGPEHSDLIGALANLGYLELLRGHPDRAELLARRSLAIAVRTHGEDAHQTSSSRLVLALLDLARDRPAAALAGLDHIARISLHSPLEPSTRADYDFARARALLATGGDRSVAATLARQALAYHGAHHQGARRAAVAAWLARHRL